MLNNHCTYIWTDIIFMKTIIVHPHTTLVTVDPKHSAGCKTFRFSAIANLTEKTISIIEVIADSSWKLWTALWTISPGSSPVIVSQLLPVDKEQVECQSGMSSLTELLSLTWPQALACACVYHSSVVPSLLLFSASSTVLPSSFFYFPLSLLTFMLSLFLQFLSLSLLSRVFSKHLNIFLGHQVPCFSYTLSLFLCNSRIIQRGADNVWHVLRDQSRHNKQVHY